MAPVLRVVGPPGSGKTLLIVSLVEALRSRGYRVTTVVRREAIESTLLDHDAARQLHAGAATTVIVLSSGGRVTMERTMALQGLRDVVASLDPSIDLLLAEGFEDAGYAAVELSPPGAPALVTSSDDLLAVVSSDQIAGAFERFGPGETNGLADLVEREVLGREPAVSMALEVDGQPVEALGFVKDVIAKPVFTMVEQLKGVGTPRSIRLSLRRRGKREE